MAINSQNTRFIWSSSTAALTTSNDATGAVGEVKNISGPTGSAGVIDITNLDSTAKEKMMGLPDEGQVSVELNFAYSTSLNDKVKDIIADRKARSKKKWGILFSDASSSLAQADGYVTGFAVSGSVDNILTANITVEIDGPVTWAS